VLSGAAILASFSGHGQRSWSAFGILDFSDLNLIGFFWLNDLGQLSECSSLDRL
jgi:hypothetical protein